MDDNRSLYNPGESDWESILVGHRIVSAEETGNDAVLTLDTGKKFKVRGNEGCGGCTNGLYWVSHIATVDNIITAVRCDVEPRQRDKYDEDAYIYRVFVITGNGEIEAVTVEGDDGNGYYGSGYSLEFLLED